MAKRTRNKNQVTRRTPKKKDGFSSAAMSLLTSVVLLIFIAMVVGRCSEDSTVSSIKSDEKINPPAAQGWVTARQIDLTQAIKDDILHADRALEEINNLPADSVAEKERQKRAKNNFYSVRRKKWAELTTPLEFKRFAGVIRGIETSTVFSGVNQGKTRLDFKVTLFNSGITFVLTQLLDSDKDPVSNTKYGSWSMSDDTGKPIQWFDFNEGDSVRVSGSFVRHTDETKWAHCCVTSKDWPVFRVMGSKISLLARNPVRDAE